MKKMFTVAALAAAMFSAPSALSADKTIVGLITKTNTNPFFVKMKEGAESKANELGLELRSFAGRYDGDNDSQIQAVENLIASGAKGILIVASDPVALTPSIERARKAGIVVIALDTPFSPANVADATFATDNFLAGELIGKWAKAKMGAKAKDAKIALLDLSTAGITVDVARNQGFLKGFGVDVKDANKMRDEDDPRIVGNDVTQGSEEGGRRAMENLLQKDPGINVVYTINEPAAAGAYEALKAVGKEKDVLLVSVDGGCPGVENIKDKVIGATSMQFPLKMASLGVEAIAEYAKSGVKPGATPGKGFFDTGVELITDEPVNGVESSTSAQGLGKCWG
ncbi:Fructose ABC transporter, substrate-binding component FrcB [Vibrio nigripulchritudo MADA3029]|uniref:Autoinducer 2-binding periplasmic protein LuxP n=1 Tax=Vibrio nigripulchritudo TaxID=28173 RepID=U4K3R4_9VIBR|nr:MULTISPECIES: sugar ABC transporter substrate-binding protein [Vibrio]UAB71601.1 sugar ABC transporter substrate-binding protein [Vibrio sp. SCSIO 43132]CCN49384.1 Fructose ABC transporter, substrate-binding component FrcB [Vibrio nigripulchritudo MADA3020]CCN51566.1 Fructose ABC transporter, substrate-binding component FrcB [Vibrio nigripulchritudo MADA3021]CCN57380.1 Fructose ABC transporter, substrate-binding component FrcB [Vibrio nigripulchritudo MADA3029]CCN83653.1 Fructose ABC transp